MEDGEDKLYDNFFSGTNFGPCVALYAPGQDIESINTRYVRNTCTVRDIYT